jgi:hypothetical protein
MFRAEVVQNETGKDVFHNVALKIISLLIFLKIGIVKCELV